MTQRQVEQLAERLGYKDARCGKVYRHSIDPGSWLMSWLNNYEDGWQRGRTAEIERKWET